MPDSNFIKALENNDQELLAKVAKSDLHNHAALGHRKGVLEKWAKKNISDPPFRFYEFNDFEKYLDDTFTEFIRKKDFFGFAITSDFYQAKNDGIKVLQLSIDTRFCYLPDTDGSDIAQKLKIIHEQAAPEILFVPQLGLDRRQNPQQLLSSAEAMLDTGYFMSIDLYGDELYGDIKNFIPIYKKAREMGLILTAHAGEYGSAESVRTAVELLGLQQVQHGISAAQSKEVMRWLADNHIVLNVCPTSNVMLCRAESIEKHPIRILYEHGVKVTINTDDLMVFNQSVSEEFLNLYNAGTLSISALDEIRNTGLRVFDK